jgi:pyruvate/2-oxoglutarate dehydrogenase complex dihydrolipoamide acyltransferase (E2) component
MSEDNGSEEVVIEEGDVGEVPAELLEATEGGEGEAESELVVPEDAEPIEATEEAELEEGEEGSAPEEPEEVEPEPAPEPEPEVAPDEPDPPQEQTGPADPEGIITELSEQAFAKLTEIWKSRGSPHQFDYQGVRWAVYDNGEKFIRTGSQGGMDQFYGSLSVG